MKARGVLVGLVLLFVLAGCGGSKDNAASTPLMPDVKGRQLDVALADIKRAGFQDKVDVDGGGTFGIIDESNWKVCEQSPAAGEPLANAPRLKVDRGCATNAPEVSAAPTTEPAPTTAATRTSTNPTTTSTLAVTAPPAPVTDITVDALYDKLNSANLGGVKNGDQFRLRAELFSEQSWGTGVTGEYSVYLKAKGGTNDLMVFVEKSSATGWHNGTKVELVVRAEERTSNGETSGGWLNAISVKTLSG